MICRDHLLEFFHVRESLPSVVGIKYNVSNFIGNKQLGAEQVHHRVVIETVSGVEDILTPASLFLPFRTALEFDQPLKKVRH